jgi:L-asparaginase
VISGGDMTAEAALCKLFYLFSQGLPAESVAMTMAEDLCGELTMSDEMPG